MQPITSQDKNFPTHAPTTTNDHDAGVMIYYPVFGAFPSFYGGSMDDYLRDTVSIRKDVEGLSNTYRRNLYHNIRWVLHTHLKGARTLRHHVLCPARQVCVELLA